MNKITPILLLLVAVLASAVMANEENSRPGGFYLRGEEEQDLIREVLEEDEEFWSRQLASASYCMSMST
jgi:hypothetical protein